MGTWSDLYRALLKTGGVAAVGALEDAMTELRKEADTPWKVAIIKLAAEAVEKYGAKGLDKISEAITALKKGKTPDVSFASLAVRSDCLAALQNAEADDKKKMNDFLVLVGQKIGVILKAVLSAVVNL